MFNLVKDDFDDIDFAKQRKESRVYRKGILENVIDVKGWDGIWELARCVGNIEGLIEAIVELTGDRIRNDIYERYCAKELEVKFVRQYFRTLFYEYARIVKEVNPKVFIYENVRGLTTHDKGNTWNIIKGIFKSLNYKITEPQILNAADYGIPQNRRRVFVVGIRNDLP